MANPVLDQVPGGDWLTGENSAYLEAPFTANGWARAFGETSELVRVVIDRTSDRLLGVHILGEYAAEMIAKATAAIEFGATAEDVGLVSHAHPTFSEAFREACLAARGEAVDL